MLVSALRRSFWLALTRRSDYFRLKI